MNIPELETSLSLKGYHWKLPVWDERLSLWVSQKLEISEFISRILVARGFEDLDAIERFLKPSLKEQLPDPFLFKGMDTGIDRMVQAIENAEPIMVLGDYDVDGATSTALMLRFFKALGVSVQFYIPDRFKEGYGPKISMIDTFVQKNIKVMVTLDCGTASFDPLEYAQKKGLDVIVIDHHLASETLPPAWALINPNQPEESPEIKQNYGHLAAVGMTFLFLVGLNQRLREKRWFETVHRPEPDLRLFLDLVALGTVCDVVPLTGINRVFVAQGLKVLNKKKNKGLRALVQVTSLEEAMTAYHLGFILGPRINAGGRIGESRLGAQLLSTDDDGKAMALAMQGDALNRQRQDIEAHLLKEIINGIEERFQGLESMPEVLVVSGQGWHAGVIGIIAGRLKERFHRPVCVISYENEIGKASGRSVLGVNLGCLIQKAKDLGLLMEGGGHSMAVGFTIHKKTEAEFRAFLCQSLQKEGGLSVPPLTIDGRVSVNGATIPFVQSLEQLGPFGMGNSLPRWLLERLYVTAPQVIQQAHIKVRLQDEEGTSIEAMAFRAAQTPLGEALLTAKNQRPMDFVGTLRVDTWQGQEKVKLFIEDACFSSQRAHISLAEEENRFKIA